MQGKTIVVTGALGALGSVVAEAAAKRGASVAALDHAKAALPERRVAGVEAEGREQFGVVLGAAGREHGEIALGKAFGGVLVDRVERIHQAIAERIGVHVERRVDEMRNVGPERLIARLDLDRGAQALALHRQPDLADALGGQLAIPALGMDRALECVEGDLPHHGVDHVLDLAGEQRLALL